MPRPRKYFTAAEKAAARRRACEKFRSSPTGEKALQEARDRYEVKRQRFADTEFRLRKNTALALSAQGIRIVSLKNLERPALRYIDAKGRVHKEDRRSAEELIADVQRLQR